MKSHYVSNEELTKALIAYKKEVRKAKREGLEKPPIPRYIGECFLKIAEHLANSPSFCQYSFREEMIMDGVENLVNYFENFNPNAISKNVKGNNFGKKTKGAFPYFTQIVFWAFVRRIGKEGKQAYIKAKSMEMASILNQLSGEDMDFLEGDSTGRKDQPMFDNISELIQNFEDKLKEKKKNKKSRKKKVNKLFEE